MHQGRRGRIYQGRRGRSIRGDAPLRCRNLEEALDMATLGSILLAGGLAGAVFFLALVTLRPRLVSRGVTVAVLTALFLIAGAGLVLLAAASGGRSLHTGG